MNHDHLIGENTGTDVFLFPPCLKEITFAMPSAKDPPLSARITHLEDELRKTSEAVTKTQGDLTGLTTHFEVLIDRAVTWRQLITGALIPLLVGAACCVWAAAAIFNSSYGNRMPQDIEYGISNSQSLKRSFDAINAQLKSLDDRLNEISKTTGTLVTPAAIAASLHDAISVSKNVLPQTLPRVKALLTLAKNGRVPLAEKTYRATYKRLFNHYVSSKTPLKEQLWGTLISCANTRTSTEAGPSESEIEQAKAGGNYFEGDIDLSSRTEWKNAIFMKCKITISKPESELILENVRFVDSDFQAFAENETDRKLLEALLEAPSPNIKLAVNRFRVTITSHKP